MKGRVPRKLKKILKKAGFDPIVDSLGNIRPDDGDYAPVFPSRYRKIRSFTWWRRDVGCW